MQTNIPATVDWRASESILVSTTNQAHEQYLLHDTPLVQFEFGVTMTLQHTDDAEPQAYGLTMQYSDSAHLSIQILKQGTRWNFAVESNGIYPVINRVLFLPQDFLPVEPHTLRLLQQSEQMTVWLDGRELLTINEHAHRAQPVLFTRNVTVTFTDVWQTAL